MLNKQIPIKQDLGHPNSLAVNSIFYTIQGEGPFAGTPAVFVRLAGCNLQCPDCDTEYGLWKVMSVSDILEAIAEVTPETNRVRCPLIVITGGEPFRQNIRKLTIALLENLYQVQVETNGTLFADLDYAFAHHSFTIVCSPKGSKVNALLWPHIKALKYVLNADSQNADDGLPILALGHGTKQVARWPEHWKGEVYIQPVDVQDENANKRHLKAAVDASLKFGYRLCLQVHKIIGVA